MSITVKITSVTGPAERESLRLGADSHKEQMVIAQVRLSINKLGLDRREKQV